MNQKGNFAGGGRGQPQTVLRRLRGHMGNSQPRDFFGPGIPGLARSLRAMLRVLGPCPIDVGNGEMLGIKLR